MKKTIKLIIKIALVLLLLIVLAGGYFGYMTYKTQGEDAVAKMTEVEKEFLLKVNEIRKGMSDEDLVSILGEPTNEVYPLYVWAVDGGIWSNNLTVKFDKDGVETAVWAKMGSFTYTPSMEKEGEEEEKEPEEN